MAFFALATVYLFLPLREANFLNNCFTLKNTLLMGAFYFLGRNTNFDSGKIDPVFSWIMVIAIAAFCLNVVEKVIGIHFQKPSPAIALFNFAIIA